MAETPSLTIRTNFTPDITFNPFSKASPETKNLILDILQPSIDGTLPIVGEIHYAPHGDPTSSGLIALIGVGMLALYGAYKLIRR